MSPKMKKILLIGGAAVVGFIVYKKMTKSAAAAPKAMTAVQLKSMIALPQMQLLKTPTTTKGTDVIAELGLEESLGSLGGAYR